MKKWIAMIFMLGICTRVYATDALNQRTRLPPDPQLKVLKVIAQARIQGQAAQTQTTNIQRNTGSNATGGAQMMLNVTNNAKQAPKEQIIYAPGGIYNICDNCR